MQINFKDSGSGPPIVFLHAFPFDGRMWDKTIRILKDAEFRTIVFDLPGFGSSHGLMTSIKEAAADVIRALEQNDIRNIVFCGISMGGYVGFEMIKQRPELFCAAVFCDTTADSDSPQKRESRRIDIRRIENGEFSEVMTAYAISLLSEETKIRRPETLKQVVDTFCNADPDSVCAALDAMAKRQSSTDTLAAFDFPVKLIFGADDPMLPHGYDLDTSIPDSSLNKIEGAGHFPNLEKPAEFNEILLNFVKWLQF